MLTRRLMAAAAVTTSSTSPGSAWGIVGFFAIPVVSAFGGFALGGYPAEPIRAGTLTAAWSSTRPRSKPGAELGHRPGDRSCQATAWLAEVTTAAATSRLYCPASRRRSQRSSRRRKNVCLLAVDFLPLPSLASRLAGWCGRTVPSPVTSPSLTLGVLGGLIA